MRPSLTSDPFGTLSKMALRARTCLWTGPSNAALFTLRPTWPATALWQMFSGSGGGGAGGAGGARGGGGGGLAGMMNAMAPLMGDLLGGLGGAAGQQGLG